MDTQAIAAFRERVNGYYAAHGRHDLPWRQPEAGGTFDPYRILVSEIMLQQTQVSRVIPKFLQFTAQFPSIEVLSATPLGDVLTMWSGLGYNRRAKFLWQAAQVVQQQYGGQLPDNKELLVMLPGIGANTACAIIAYAYNTPAVFIETNIRTVLIHHFFADEHQVSDARLAELVQATLPATNYRQWYWALMDYGTHLKQTVGNLSTRSKTFTKQSKFHGSKRHVRGQVLKLLSEQERTKTQLVKQIVDERLPVVLADLLQEGLIMKAGPRYMLPRM